MGRPLKIQQLSPGSGDASTNGIAVHIDTGYPQFNNLDQPTVVKPGAMTGNQYLGVTGGGYNGGVASTTFPVVAISANVNGVSGNAYIVTQKGQTKYLVAATDSVTAGSFTPGFSYIIKTLGNTNWSAAGAGVNAQVGDVFTALNAGSGTGTASDVGQAILTNSGSLTTGQMSMVFNPGSGNVYASRLTNKFIWDNATPPNKYVVNFFTSNVTTAGSGADSATWTNGTGNYTLAQVADYTS